MARIVGVDGLDELKTALSGLMGKVADATDAGHTRLARQAAAEMRANAPRDTGRLAGTIRVRRDNPFQSSVVAGEEGATPYLGHQEFGTRHQPARPFVRPAAGRAESTHGSAMLSEARKRIR